MAKRRDASFTLYDLRVEVVKGDKPIVTRAEPGEYFDVIGGRLVFPKKSFSLYALMAVLPFLPAKQRPTGPADWMTTDTEIAKRYTAEDLEGKGACKLALQEELRLRPDAAPLIGMVTRLAAQKGLDIVVAALPALVTTGVQLALLGSGEPAIEEALVEGARRYPGQVTIRLGYDAALARRIYAGADAFLMPSRYEPCGLGQLISLRYGTVPIVRRTGGLADTVSEFDPDRGNGNGFVFDAPAPEPLLAALGRALRAYRQPSLWKRLMRNGMAEDFSWEASAREYVALYQKAIRRARRSLRGGAG